MPRTERITLDEIKLSSALEHLWVFDDSTFQEYIKAKIRNNPEITESSFRKYVPVIARFCKYYKTTPGEIVQSSQTEAQRKQWKVNINDWFDNMTNAGKNTKDWNYMVKLASTVNEFFELLELDLNYKSPKLAKIDSPYVPSKEVLQKAVEKCNDPMLKSYIFVAKECGLSWVDLKEVKIDEEYYDQRQRIKYDSVRSQLLKGKVPVFIIGNREKTSVPYVGLLGEEAISNLTLSGDRLVGFPKIRTLDYKFEQLSQMIGEPEFEPKCLRAFLATNIRDVEMNELLAKIITGHKIRDIEKFYVNFSQPKIEKAFNYVYENLRIYPRRNSINSESR